MDSLAPSVAASRPRLSGAQAEEFAEAVWGVRAEARELPSERDQNFLLVGPSAERHVLKLSNSAEPLAVVALQSDAAAALSAAGLPYGFPRPLPTTAGELIATAAGAGHEGFARLLEHVPGRPLGETRPHSAALMGGLGEMLGHIDVVLAAMDAPAADRPLVWRPEGAAELIRDHLQAIEDPGRRALVAACADRCQATIERAGGELRRSIIHHDANDANVLVRAGPLPEGKIRIAGLVDFGDIVRSWTVAEPAVACAYAGLGKKDPVAAWEPLVAGYHAANPLTEPEVDVLGALIRLRLCLSVVVSAVRSAHDPDNEYLIVSQAPAWALLEQLGQTGEAALVRYRLRRACGLPAHPASGDVSQQLRDHAAEAAPLVSPDPRQARTLVLDLSVESGDDGGTFDPTDHRAFTRVIFDRMRDAGDAVGIGRYDEVRWWYTGDAFAAPGDDRDAWRSVHLGIDIFLPPGTSVFAPLAGRVHSLANNGEPLDYGPTIILEHPLDGVEGIDRLYTLYGHLTPASLELLSEGSEVRRGEKIGEIGDRSDNGGWAPHVHFQVILDLLGYHGTFPGVAAPGVREVWKSLSPDPNLLLGITGDLETPPVSSVGALATRRRERLGPSLSLSYRRPLHIVRGRGAYLYDSDGQPYLDCVNNVAHVGHSHPRVAEAARRQMTVLNTNTRYLHEAILEYSERLAALLPDPLGVCFFVCSGSEANELALRMARAHTGSTDVIVVEGAYHGNTTALVDISPYKFDGPGGRGAPGWVHVAPMPDLYRGRYRADDREAGGGRAIDARAAAARYAGHVRAAAEAIPAGGLAAFFCESLLSCAGQIPLPDGYLADAYPAVREAGGVCVADEVQVGFGRVGSHFWGFETQGVVPDIVTLGKPIGNGHPLAAVVTTPEIAASFDTGMEYFNTFGGNPVSCAAGLAVLDVIRDERLQEHAAEVGNRLMEGLTSLADRHSLIGDVRGRGLFLGIELVLEGRAPAPHQAAYVVNRMRDRGVLLSTDGPDHNVIKIKPPLVFSETNADRLVRDLEEVLSDAPLQSAEWRDRA